MPTRTSNTMAEGLPRMLALISELKTAPDADLQFLIGVETLVLGKIHEPQDQVANQLAPGQGPMPGGPPAPAPPGGGLMPGGPMPGQGPQPIPGPPMGGRGLQVGPGAPPPDEIRRMTGPGPG